MPILEKLRLRPASVLGELVIVLVGVLLALAADRWNQARLDRAAELEYLVALFGDLATDTASQSLEIERAAGREASARLVLAVVLGEQPITDPSEFILSVVDAGIYGEPVLARDTFDDLVQTGRLGLIRDVSLRTQLADYYRFVERRSQSYELQRERVWGDYMPLSVAALPLELQEWSYGLRGRRPTSAPAPTFEQASAVSARLRAMPGIEAALKGVVRSSWSLVDNWRLMRDEAGALLVAIQPQTRP